MQSVEVSVSTAHADPALIEAFARSSTAIISDNLSRLPGAIGLRPFYRGGTMAGTALTVRTAVGDNLFIHKALELVRPGDIVVVDGGGDCSRALVGEIMATIASTRGAAGLVIDGAVRDARALIASSFPCFARTAIHRGPFKNGPGQINVPVVVGGMIVTPGDIVVGDEDGIVAFSPAAARELLQAVHAQEHREAEIMTSIREGCYGGGYAK